MEWNNTTSLELISLYQKQECLWNSTDINYKSKTKKLDAWNEISDTLKCESTEVKRKMDSLLSSFRRERQKQEMKTGSGTEDVYKSTWFAFKHMLFLLDKFVPKQTINTEENLEKIDKSDSNDIISDDSTTNIEEKNDAPPQTSSTGKSVFLSQKKNKRQKRMAVDSRSEEAYKILQDTVQKRNLRDDSTIYGDLIASKHRKYSSHTRSVVEHLISNILFKADMGHYESDTQVKSHSQNFHSNSTTVSNYHQEPQSFRVYSSTPSPSNSIHTFNYDQQSQVTEEVTQTSYVSTPSPSPSNSTSLVDYINTFN